MATITNCKLFEVPPRWLFLRLETSDGIVSWGEPVVEGRSHTVRGMVEELLETHLLGEDPNRIEDHWQAMYRGGFYRGGPVLMSIIAGIDQALWGIKGKQFGVPIYDLLGGPVRDRARVYQWIGGDRPEDIGEAAREKVVSEFSALKMNTTPELQRVDNPAAVQEAQVRLRTVREIVGDEVHIGVDFHGRVTKPMAKRLAATLEEFEPFFIEELVLLGHNDALPEIATHTSKPIATAEWMFSKWDFRQISENRPVDVIQPDLSHAGGITEIHKIASMAETYDVALAPHCPLGPIALASCLQVDAVAPNALIQEPSLDIPDYLVDPSVFDYDDGYVELPASPGLGVDIDAEYVGERAEIDVDWHNLNDDGSIAEC